MENRMLYFGDNLEILRQRIPDESFDLIYLDPPFNSNRNYNVLFKEGLQDSPAQIKAFDDSWHWTKESKRAFDYLVTKTNENISNLMLALEKIIGHNDLLAYLAMMTIRLIELHRVLKKTGSLYLHCDPTASHYLKIVLDTIFDKQNFRNEIIWKRTSNPKGSQFDSRKFGQVTDTILFYSKTENYFIDVDGTRRKLTEEEMTDKYPKKDDKGSYLEYPILRSASKGERPNLVYEYKGFTPPKWGWVVRKEKLIEIDKRGDLGWRKNGSPFRKYRPHEDRGEPIDNLWDDILRIQSNSSEALGYPTQKPEALLERILKASSKDGDWVLDPFCGCGTTVAAAEKLNRNWVGIDITALAINLIKHRLHDHFGLGKKEINVDGFPADLNGANELFKKDPFEFEYWALDLINAMTSRSKTKENRRGADKGIDGVITFHKDKVNGNTEYGQAIVQVKGGGVQRNQIAVLKSDVEREGADSGIFVTLEKPTKPMKSEAVDAGTFTTPITGKREFPKIQILTVEELLKGVKPDLPHGLVNNYYKEAKATEREPSKKTQAWLMF